MTCSRCQGKGFILRVLARDNTYFDTIAPCPEQCDPGAYSAEVQRRLNDDPEDPTPVFPVPRVRLFQLPRSFLTRIHPKYPHIVFFDFGKGFDDRVW